MLVLDLGLGILCAVAGLRIRGDGLARRSLDKDLGAPASGTTCAAFLVLCLGLGVLCVAGIHVQGDSLIRQRLHKDLEAPAAGTTCAVSNPSCDCSLKSVFILFVLDIKIV